MSESATSRVAITRLPTGVPGLDEVLGGGLPEYSFTLVAGAPGTGKTTLAHQLLFSLASPERRALYFSVVGEPMLKILRYQQQMAYFDPARVGDSIHFINLSDGVLTQGLDQVLADIVRQVEETSPGLVVLDSFHNIAHLAAGREPGGRDVQGFVQRLALHLTSWQTTTLLLGNYAEQELRENPVFTLADGVLWLSQVADHNSVVRKLQVVKMRGQELMPGLHTVRLDQAGLQVFPRCSSRRGYGRASRGSSPSSRSPPRSTCGAPSAWAWAWRRWCARAASPSSTSGRWTSRRTRRCWRSARPWRASGRGGWPSIPSRVSSWHWRRTSGRISASRCT